MSSLVSEETLELAITLPPVLVYLLLLLFIILIEVFIVNMVI